MQEIEEKESGAPIERSREEVGENALSEVEENSKLSEEEIAEKSEAAENSQLKPASDEKSGVAVKEEAAENSAPSEPATAAKDEADEEERREKEREEWFEKDRENFFSTYPDVDIDKVLSDGRFVRFATHRVGVDPLSDIYADYKSVIDELEAKAKEEAKVEWEKKMAKQNASPGSLTEIKAEIESEYYTLDEIKKMSAEYIDEHWDKVRRSIQRAKK